MSRVQTPLSSLSTGRAPSRGAPVEHALVAQLDRAPDFESVGRRFNSCRVYSEAARRRSSTFQPPAPPLRRRNAGARSAHQTKPQSRRERGTRACRAVRAGHWVKRTKPPRNSASKYPGDAGLRVGLLPSRHSCTLWALRSRGPNNARGDHADVQPQPVSLAISLHRHLLGGL